MAQRLRELASLAAVEDLDHEGWEAVRSLLDQASASFAPGGGNDRSRFARGFTEAARHPVAEGTSGVYPPFDLRIYDGLLVAETSFDAAWEGPPDLVHGGYLALAAMLGRRTAELHRALALRTGYPSFDPEPLTAQDLQAWRLRAATDAGETLSLLERRLADLPPATQADAQALLARRAAVLEGIEATANAPAALHSGGLKTRYHGDYHLGQVLVTGNDFVLIDFEGEPGRSFEQRRAKGSPLRDVAGMLRSFNYARWAALRHMTQSTEEMVRLDEAARDWEHHARDAFLEAYATAGTHPDLDLVALFELEKALYELRYELGNRVDWVQVPLQGILALVGATPGP